MTYEHISDSDLILTLFIEKSQHRDKILNNKYVYTGMSYCADQNKFVVIYAEKFKRKAHAKKQEKKKEAPKIVVPKKEKAKEEAPKIVPKKEKEILLSLVPTLRNKTDEENEFCEVNKDKFKQKVQKELRKEMCLGSRRTRTSNMFFNVSLRNIYAKSEAF